MSECMLEFNDVSFSYNNDHVETPVLRSLSFQVGKQELFGFVGPSGCGKTTILKIASDLVAGASAGRVVVDSVAPAVARRERRIAILFQRPILLPWRNVLDNVLLPVQIAGSANKDDLEKAKKLLDLAGMAEFGEYRVHELSGGMQQRVSLVRCLMSSPRILLLDEPFASLDELLKEELLELLQQISKQLALTVVHVSHSLEDSVLLCDRVAVLSPRPSHIAQIVQIPLGRPRCFTARMDQAYLASLTELRNALRHGHCAPDAGDHA